MTVATEAVGSWFVCAAPARSCQKVIFLPFTWRPLIGEDCCNNLSHSLDLFVDHNDIDLLNRVGLHHHSGE